MGEWVRGQGMEGAGRNAAFRAGGGLVPSVVPVLLVLVVPLALLGSMPARLAGQGGAAADSVRGAAGEASEVRWSEFTLEVGDSAVAAEVGRMTVPEVRGATEPGEVELAFVRLPTRAADPGPPIVYLDGGPGGSGYGIARVPAYYRLFDALRDVADVILLSQRGTGLSRPRLGCALSSPLPGDLFTTRERMLETLRPEVEACAVSFRGRGVQLGGYTTRESADDVDALRRGLGADSISLLGFSYGTHLALATLRRHGDRVARAVLIGTEGPDHTLKLPGTGDRQIRHLAALAAADPAVAEVMPDLYAAIDTLLRRLDAEPVSLAIRTRDGPRTIALGGDGMRYLLRRDLGDTNDHPVWPAALRMALDGDFRATAGLAGRRFNELAGVPLMAILMDCASGASPERMARIRAQRAASLLGAMMDSWYPEICTAVPEARLDDDFRTPFVSDVPTLLLAGTLDANTPPWQARQVSWGWPHATQITVDRAGHETLMPWPPAQRVIVDFFR
ncbi:MAG: alpha/beta fold hydrolase, partial [Candidatus Longimicrobiales bacterium M2_2A_002]